jgi:lysophospholipase L1-like esterase
MKRQFIYAITIIILFLALMETAARIVESKIFSPSEPVTDRPGWQHKFFGSLLDWHENDPELLWRFKAGLDNPLIRTNSDHLLGDEIPLEKDPSSYYILLLGDSSPVGLGLVSRRQAFGEIARYMLDKQIGGGRRVELINAAVSGYTSEQMVRFLEIRGWRYNPDIVVLYCGNNDASISGTRSDQEIMTGQQFKSLRAFLGRSAIYRLMRGLLLNRPSPESNQELQLKVRVSPERYAENLAGIYRQCRRHKRPLIVLKPPVPYLWPAGLQFRPFIHVTDQEGEVILPEEMARILGREISYCLDEERFRELYGKGDVFTQAVYRSGFQDTMAPTEAIEYYADLIASDPDNPLYLNNQGVAFWRNNDYEKADKALKKARQLYRSRRDNSPAAEASGSPILFNVGINLLSMKGGKSPALFDTTGVAFRYLDSALQADYFSLRIKRDYWRTIDELKGRKGIAVLDLSEIFAANGGERLFIDHCHPTPEGHRLMAKEIVRTITDHNW